MDEDKELDMVHTGVIEDMRSDNERPKKRKCTAPSIHKAKHFRRDKREDETMEVETLLRNEVHAMLEGCIGSDVVGIIIVYTECASLQYFSASFEAHATEYTQSCFAPIFENFGPDVFSQFLQKSHALYNNNLERHWAALSDSEQDVEREMAWNCANIHILREWAIREMVLTRGRVRALDVEVRLALADIYDIVTDPFQFLGEPDPDETDPEEAVNRVRRVLSAADDTLFGKNSPLTPTPLLNMMPVPLSLPVTPVCSELRSVADLEEKDELEPLCDLCIEEAAGRIIEFSEQFTRIIQEFYVTILKPASQSFCSDQTFV